MRPLRRYINEIGNLSTLHAFIMEQDNENDTIELRDLTAVWNGPDKLYLEIPESYSESDMQLYMDDSFLQQLPAGDKLVEQFFGINKDNIADVYFEYDSIEQAMGTDQKADIEWDSRYDSKVNSDEKLNIMCINSLRYIVVFDKFEMVNTHEDDIKYEIIKIFDATNSNKTNEYPFEIIFDGKNIEYKE